MADIRDLEKSEQHLPTHQEIEQKAHEIYLRRGGQQGRDLDDWLAAEAELTKERQTMTDSVPSRSKTAMTGGSVGFASRTNPPK
jgi:hypothetical protein